MRARVPLTPATGRPCAVVEAMADFLESRRQFLKTGLAAGALLVSSKATVAQGEASAQRSGSATLPKGSGSADYTLHIKNSPVEIAHKRIDRKSVV